MLDPQELKRVETCHFDRARPGWPADAALHAAGFPLLVVDEQRSELADIQAKGIETLTGPAGEQALLDRVNLAGARWLILAIPNAF